jgi:hypothetical protein
MARTTRPSSVNPIGRRVVNAVWLIARCLPADGLTIEQHSESAGDQEVFHLHFHLMPRQEGVPLKAPRGEIEKPETLTKQAEHIELRSLRCSSCAAEVGPHKLGCFDLGGLPPGRILLYDFHGFAAWRSEPVRSGQDGGAHVFVGPTFLGLDEMK